MSRDLRHLSPKMRGVAVEHQERMAALGWDLLIYSTRRSHEEQARLFRQGRPYSEIVARAELLRDKYGRQDLHDVLLGVGPQHGRRVTNAAPGQSAHNPNAHGLALAYDAVPMRDGVPLWQWSKTSAVTGKRIVCDWWQDFGSVIIGLGVEWGGKWRRPDGPHVQVAGFDWKTEIRREAGLA